MWFKTVFLSLPMHTVVEFNCTYEMKLFAWIMFLLRERYNINIIS